MRRMCGGIGQALDMPNCLFNRHPSLWVNLVRRCSELIAARGRLRCHRSLRRWQASCVIRPMVIRSKMLWLLLEGLAIYRAGLPIANHLLISVDRDRAFV